MTDSAFQHLYGMMDGVFLTAVILLFLFGIKTVRARSNWRISASYMLLALSILCFGLYNIFFQNTHDAVTAGFHPSWLVKLGTLAVPVALAILTYMIHWSLSLYSYAASVALKQVRWYTNLLFVLYAAVFVALIFTDDIHTASRMILLTFIFPCLSGSYIAWKGLDNRHVSRLVGFSFLFLAVGTSLMIWLTFDNRLMGKPHIIAGIHFSYALFVILTCHTMLSMGRDELNDLFKRYGMDKLHIRKDIVPALTEGQFRLNYQPQVNLKKQAVSGIEALIRWQHPTKGNIPPNDFIPIAEETGLIENITMWVVEESVGHAKQLIDKGRPLEVSINFSPSCFKRSVVDHLEKQLSKHAVPAELMIIEITENMMLKENDPEVIAAFAKLHEMGVQLSIDDYGTGFSSLSYLKKMSIRELKIDRSFVMDMQDNKDNYAIVNSTLQMTKSLDIAVVAEGVETEAVLNSLTGMGCDKAQGYGIAKPMSFHALTSYLGISDAAKSYERHDPSLTMSAV